VSLDHLKPLADDLFGRYGLEVTYRVTPISGSPYDPTPGTPVDYTVNASPPAKFTEQQRDGTLIQTDDVLISIAAEGLAVVPSVGGDGETTELVIDGDSWQIVAVHPVYYGESVGHYDVRIGR
jgi:hypothetical protein